MKKLNILLGFMFVFFLFQGADAQTLYEQNFNNLNLGALAGQDFWTNIVLGTAFYVQDVTVYEGGKALNITADVSTHTINRSIPYSENGSVFFYGRFDGTNGGFLVSLFNGTNEIHRIRFHPDGNIKVTHTAADTSLTAWVSGQWYNLTIKWDSASTYTACVNETICSTGNNFIDNVGRPDSIQIISPDVVGPDGISFMDYLFHFNTFDPPPANEFGISISTPANSSFHSPNVELNVTVTFDAANFTYSLDGAANVSVLNDTNNITSSIRGLAEGAHFLLVYATDSAVGSDVRWSNQTFYINSTAEATFISSLDLSVVNNVFMTMKNFTAEKAFSTTDGLIRFAWTDLVLGDVTIEVNTSDGGLRNQSSSFSIGVYEGFNETFSISPAGQFNVSVFDELDKKPYNFSITNSTLLETRLKMFCADREFEINITSGFTEGLNFSCVVTEARMLMKFAGETTIPYRSLKPEGTLGALNFWMWENITEDTIFLQSFKIKDLIGTFKDGRLNVFKLINDSTKTIHQVDFNADGTAFAYLVDGERYELQLVSNDGAQIKNLGSFNALFQRSSVDAVLEATTLLYNPPLSFLFKDVGWTFSNNPAAPSVSLSYRDSLNETTSITFTVRNSTNMSQVFYTASSTERATIYDFSYTVPEVNTTYNVGFVSEHLTHGEIIQSSLQSFSNQNRRLSIPGIPADANEDSWYLAISMFLIIVTALVFGAKFSGIAGIIVSLEGGLFWYLGWLNATGGAAPVVSLLVILLGVTLAVLDMIRRGETT